MDTLVYHNPEVTFTYYLIIPHTDLTTFRVLLRQNDDKWSLPSYQPQEHHFGVVKHINDFASEQFGLFAATLRCLQTHIAEDSAEHRFYALDNLHSDWDPPTGWQWLDEEEMKDLTFQDDFQHDMLQDWFTWMYSDASLRVPWMRPHWFPNVANWMYDLADRMAMETSEPVQQIRAWSRSCTLRLATDNDTLYLKAVPEIFNYEPVITRVLGIRFPGHVPDVRAVHVENGWMLMRDFGGTSLDQIHDIAVWETVLRHYADMQINLIANAQSMVGLGVPDRNVDYLSSQIERLMHDLPEALAEDEQAELKRMASSLRTMCFELTEHNIPLTLTHGDLWSDNIIIKPDGEILFFDWSTLR